MTDPTTPDPTPRKRAGGIGRALGDVEPPSRDAVRAWAQIGAAVTDEQLDQVIEAEVAIQAATCDLGDGPAYPPEMTQALYRRVARECAARGLPLGLTDVSGEYGPARIPTWDAEITRLEASRKAVPIA